MQTSSVFLEHLYSTVRLYVRIFNLNSTRIPNLNCLKFHFSSDKIHYNRMGSQFQTFQPLSATTSFESIESVDELQDEFGWYSDEDYESKNETSQKASNAWIHAVTEISLEPRGSQHHTKPSDIIFVWNNPFPSLSVKASSSDITRQLMTPISGCVGGLRLCQYSCGEIRIEFNFIFCYGSRSYSCWKSYSEFKKLFVIVKTMQERGSTHSFSATINAWQNMLARKKWFRCYEIKYLIQKSILLGRFMEALLHEAPSPGLILSFVQSPRLQLSMLFKNR